MHLFIEYPTWIVPTIIPGLPIRWYSLMYIFAFATTYILVRNQVKKKEFDSSVDDTINLFIFAIAGLILGARLFSTLLYDGSWYYWTHPWMIFWPFRNGRFVGLPGMSYHGGLVGTIVAVIIYCRIHHRRFFEVADVLVAGIPLGYTFGRLGNFINGELWGRASSVPWAMVFPDAPSYSTNHQWVRDFAERIGIEFSQGALINLPRHPSQLYEALFEGVVLWLFLWFIMRPRKQYHGFLLAWYIIGYGFARFFIEYVREPDSNLGFVIAWGKNSSETALFTSFLNISMGQILCMAMIVFGFFVLFYSRQIHQKQAATAEAMALKRQQAAIQSQKARKSSKNKKKRR